MKIMKRLLCFLLTAILILAPASTVFAKQHGKGNQHQTKHTQLLSSKVREDSQNNEDSQGNEDNQNRENNQIRPNYKIKEMKQHFKINGSPIIQYGRYKLPISPVTKGMGAVVTFDKTTAVLTVTKNSITVVIDFINQTVTVNGVADTKSGIFTAKNDKKMNVLISYIARTLGCRADAGKDDVTVTVPGLDSPAHVTVTAVGGTVTANTLNSSNLFLTASADIKAGQAAGGKAELYVGNKLVATDSVISATDTSVTFTTSDESPTNAELQAAVPAGGLVTVKLYNSNNESVTSKELNLTLTVDYTAPTITGIATAVYSVSGSAISIGITGGSAVGDKVDVTKISLFDSTLGKTYQLTAAPNSGSTGVVNSADSLLITLGTADQHELQGFGATTVYLFIAPGPLITDTAGNISPSLPTVVPVPVTVIQ